MKKLVIAIDGFSSTGKSSISKIIAQKLNLVHLDTGALYRGITYYAVQHCQNEDGSINISKLIDELSQINIEFKKENGELALYLNGENISNEIRQQKISDLVSHIAKEEKIRHFLLKIQREHADKGGIIMDGRDIGTVILPNADFKFFLTATDDVRAQRRLLELQQLNIPSDFETVKKNLIARDKIDSERDISPLRQAHDALLIDTSDKTKDEIINLILSKIEIID